MDSYEPFRLLVFGAEDFKFDWNYPQRFNKYMGRLICVNFVVNTIIVFYLNYFTFDAYISESVTNKQTGIYQSE
jgi:hypothetical protein